MVYEPDELSKEGSSNDPKSVPRAGFEPAAGPSPASPESTDDRSDRLSYDTEGNPPESPRSRSTNISVGVAQEESDHSNESIDPLSKMQPRQPNAPSDYNDETQSDINESSTQDPDFRTAVTKINPND